MKKYILLYFLPLTAYNHILAQQTVHLLISYLPNHNYYLTTDQTVKFDVDLNGDEGGTANSKTGSDDSKKTQNIKIERQIKTGKLYNDSLFHYQEIITKVSGTDAVVPIKAGLTTYWTGSTSGATTFDSISAKGIDEGFSEKMLPLLKNTLQQVSVPKHTFREGDSFTFEGSFSIPFGEASVDFTVSHTYTLKSVSQGIAHFSISNTYTMKSESSGLPLTGEGYGSGSMLYDIKDNYFTKYELEYSLNIAMNIAGKEMKMGMQNLEVQNVKITSN